MTQTHPHQHARTTRRTTSACHALLAAMLFVMLTGCDGAATTLEGAWLGEGKFHTRAGDADVKVQLEILSDGTYRYLVLEPAVLAFTGLEEGTWSRTGQTLTLTHIVAPPASANSSAPNTSGSVFQQLRAGSEARPPRDLTIADDLSALRLNDGQLDITFTPNPDATAQLRAAGEVAHE